jgi:branched-chain amino acid transport system ATP-binding protein
VGANGAGKTTALKVISGLLRCSSGQVALDGHQRLDRLSAHEIVKLGVSHAPEGRQIFGELTVAQNLALGAYTRRDRDEIRRDLESVFSYFPVLRERTKQQAGTLSGGEQQMLAIGRALMARPRLLLLDEPSLGLAPKFVQTIFRIIQEIKERGGLSILLVEQNVQIALSLANRGYVLSSGKVLLEGQGRSLLDDERVRHTYLGSAAG